MANSLGTLTLDLIAKISGFVGPLEKAEKATKKQTDAMAKSFDNFAKGVGTAIGAVVAGVPAIVGALVTSSANAAKEITNLSTLAGLGTTQFQKFAAAAASVGIEQDKLSDILKDTNDKVGDFLATGGGELQNFFSTIAPKVGVTAEQFRKLNSAEALQLYVSTLEKANVSQSQMTFFMEAIADEATALAPLLANDGKLLRELGDAAQDTGAVMDEQTIAAAKAFNTELTVLGQYATAAKTQLAAEFMPVLAQLAKDLNSTTKEAGGLRVVVGQFADGLVETAAVIASVGDGTARVFTITAEAIVGTFATAMHYMQRLGAGANNILSFITFGDISKEFKATAEGFANDAKINFGVAQLAAEGIRDSLERPLAGDNIRKYVADAKKAAADLPPLITTGAIGPGVTAQTEAQKKAGDAAAAAAKKIQSSYDGVEQDLKRQIALINTTADARNKATEVAKLQFDIESGKLVGINSQQQERLIGLAAELDSLNKLKQANEDALKLAQFKLSIDRENATVREGFNAELAGAGSGDKLRERLQADLAIQQEYNDKFTALRDQLTSKDITQEQHDAETAVLEEALAERMVLQEDYYNRLDEIQGDWMLGVQDAWANFADSATDFNTQAAEATSTILGEAASGTKDLIHSVLTDSQSAGDAVKNLFVGLGQTVVNVLEQMAAEWLVYQAVQLLVGKTTQASSITAQVANATAASFQAQVAAFASTAAIPIVGPILAPGAALAAAAATAPMVAGVAAAASSGLAGMAHDGMEFIPEDGSWYLQKGERVTTAETSAKLDNTLTDIQTRQQQQNGGVTIIEDASKAGQTRQNDDGSVSVWVANFMNEGESYDAIRGKLGISAVGR